MPSFCADWLLQNGWGLPQNGDAGNLTTQLANLLRHAISIKALKPGDKLPATRDLMSDLSIGRNTVTHAYEQLRAEGYIQSRVGSGTFVAENIPHLEMGALDIRQKTNPSRIYGHKNTAVEEPVFSQRAQSVLQKTGASPLQWGAFMPGVPDVNAFPKAIYSKILNDIWKNVQPEMLTYGTTGGAMPLKAAICDYLRISRGVHCEVDQILITEGVHQAIDLVIRLFANPKDSIWVEDPGYWGIANVIKMNVDVDVVATPLDKEGMVIDTKRAPPKLIFVTPSHQYPLGSVMSLNRRHELIAYAQQHQCWIVEDDYDSEFRFNHKPLPAMQGLADLSPVLYIGTFSKTMFPGLRVGYLVLPKNVYQGAQRLHSELYRQGHVVTQLAIARFMQEGHFMQHIRKMRMVYGQRREWLQTLINKYLGPEFLDEELNQAGLHLILNLPNHIDDVYLSRQLQDAGVLSRALSKYYQSENSRKGLVLGYAAINQELMQKSFFELLYVLKQNRIA